MRSMFALGRFVYLPEDGDPDYNEVDRNSADDT